MGNGWSSISCTSYFCFDWLMSRRNNLVIIAITITLYIINQIIKKQIPIEPIRWFMSCYFNDTIGGMTFIAYCNIVFSFYNRKMVKLWQIEALLFFAGLFWEYVTPLFRENTISDIWDVFAYMMGGFLYWILTRKEEKWKLTRV